VYACFLLFGSGYKRYARTVDIKKGKIHI
jgi:hypothetical protein